MHARARAAALLAGLWLLGASPAYAGDDADAGSAQPAVPAAAPDDPADPDAAAHAELERARADRDAARQRMDRAVAAYAVMRDRDYPRGDARAKVVMERDSARRAYDQSNARVAELEQRAQD